MCNSTSTSSQWSTRPSVWPQTKEMWASIHFHVPLCLFCEIRLTFNRCYFSPVRFSLRPVWPEMNWPLLHVIDIVWLPRATAARHLTSSRAIKRPEEFKLFFFSPTLHQAPAKHEKLQLETWCHPDANTWNGPAGSLSDKGDSVTLCYTLTWLRLEQWATERLMHFLPSLIFRHTQPN